MEFELSIDGVQYHPKAGSVHIAKQANGRATCSFSLISEDRSYRPPLDGEVIIEVEGTKVFAGLINQPNERGFGGGLHPGILTTVSASDYHAYAERRYINGTIPSGTLKSVLTEIATYFSGYGVTLDAGQVDGPTMPEMDWDYARADEVLNRYMALTADAGQPFVWRIDNEKVLSAFQPSTAAAPFDLIGNELPEVIGDIEVLQTRGEYANRVIVKVPPKQEDGRVESFTGDGVTDTFQLHYTLTSFPYGVIHVFESDGVTPAGGETFGIPPDAPLQWEYDPDTNSITRAIGPTEADKVYKLTFNGFFEAVAIAEDAAEIAAHGIWEKVILVENVPTDTTAQAIADAELAKRVYAERTVKYHTKELGIEPGQTQTIQVSSRNLNVTAMITEVVIRDWGPRLLLHQVTAVVDSAQTNLDRGWRNVYKIWAGDKTGTAAAPVVSAPVSGGPGTPFTSVQFNRSGAFGGKETFEFKEDSDTVLVGLDHTVEPLFVSDCGDTFPDPTDEWDIAESNIVVDATGGVDGTAGIASTTAPYTSPWLLKEIAPSPANRLRFKWSQWIPTGALPFSGFTHYIVAGIYYANGSPFAFSNRQLSINSTEDGELFFTRGSYDGTTIAGPTSSPIWVENQWNHVEVEVLIHDTDGEITLWRNGVLMLSATGLDTQALGDAAIDGIEIVPQGIAGADACIDNVEIGVSQRNLAVGREHDLKAFDSFATGVGHTLTGRTLAALGRDVTIGADSSVGINLTDTPRTLTDDNTFAVWADQILFNGAEIGGVEVHYASPEYDAGTSGTSKTIDWDDGNTQLVELTGNVTFTFSNPKSGGRYLLALLQDATGSRTVTWPASVKWAAGTAPTLSTTAGKVDIVTFVYLPSIGASGNYLAAANTDYTPA